jgi:hypothetical protein
MHARAAKHYACGTPWKIVSSKDFKDVTKKGNLYSFRDKCNGSRYLVFISKRPANEALTHHIRDTKGQKVDAMNIFLPLNNKGLAPWRHAIIREMRGNMGTRGPIRENLDATFNDRSPKNRQERAARRRGNPAPRRPAANVNTDQPGLGFDQPRR